MKENNTFKMLRKSFFPPVTNPMGNSSHVRGRGKTWLAIEGLKHSTLRVSFLRKR